MQSSQLMMLSLDDKQADIVRDTLASALNQLRIESARADSSEFRRDLHDRERVVEAVLEKLSSPH